jgi:Tol biopolymer transport system component
MANPGTTTLPLPVLVRVALFAALPALAVAADAPTRVERGNLVIENVPDVPADIAERLNQYQQTRAASFEGWLADGSILITTRFAETAQVHRVDHPGGARRQLTFYAEPVNGAAPSPDGRGMLLSKDIGGNEFYQLYGFAFADGRARLLTDGKSRNTEPRWSNDGRQFAFSTTRRNGQDTDVHVMAADGTASRPALEDQGSWSVMDWSPDDRKLLVSKYISISDSELWVVPLDGSSPKERFHVTGDEVAMGPALFSRDGKGVYYVSDEGSQFRHLRYENLDGKGGRILTGKTPWDVQELALSRDGRHLEIGRAHV